MQIWEKKWTYFCVTLLIGYVVQIVNMVRHCVLKPKAWNHTSVPVENLSYRAFFVYKIHVD